MLRLLALVRSGASWWEVAGTAGVALHGGSLGVGLDGGLVAGSRAGRRNGRVTGEEVGRSIDSLRRNGPDLLS